jgi:hypothetical protein
MKPTARIPQHTPIVQDIIDGPDTVPNIPSANGPQNDPWNQERPYHDYDPNNLTLDPVELQQEEQAADVEHKANLDRITDPHTDPFICPNNPSVPPPANLDEVPELITTDTLPAKFSDIGVSKGAPAAPSLTR